MTKRFCLQCITDRSTGLHYFMTTPASWVVPLNTPLNIGCNLVPRGLGKSKLSRDNPTSCIYIWLVTPLTMTTLRFFKYCNVRISPSTHQTHHGLPSFSAKATASASLKRRRISLSHFFPEIMAGQPTPPLKSLTYPLSGLISHWFSLIRPYLTLICEGGCIRGGWLIGYNERTNMAISERLSLHDYHPLWSK